MGRKNPEFEQKSGLAAPRLGCSHGIRATSSSLLHALSGCWRQRRPRGSCRHGEGKELLEPRSLDAQGHGQCHQEQGAVGLTPEQHPGLWDQLQLGAHASF